MQKIRNLYLLLEQSGLTAIDRGPGAAHGTLSANVSHLVYENPPGTVQGYKGVIIAASLSRIVSTAAAGFNTTEGSIEMLVKPSWNYDDGICHFFFDTYEGANKRFSLFKWTDGTTRVRVQDTDCGNFTYTWAANTTYHVVVNWGANQLYINKVLEHTFTPMSLGAGAANLYIGDYHNQVNYAFNGNIYYFITRDVPLSLDEIVEYYNFFTNQYV